jgi:hypothetical protein
MEVGTRQITSRTLIMIPASLLKRLTNTIARRLWLLVVPLALLNASCATTSSNGKPDTGRLTVSIASPASGATVSGSILFSAITNSNPQVGFSDITGVPIATLQFQVDGVKLGAAQTNGHHSVMLDTKTLANGKHSLTVIATDTSNSATSSTVSITVNNGNSASPSVSISSPASGATVSGTITVTASASDSVSIASVQFQIDGSNLGAADSTAPYSASLNTTTLTNGKHSLTAIATDTSNDKATSAAVSITVNNGNKTPPSISITSPASGATVSGTITVTASASDSVSIASVQFQIDGSNLGAADSTAPYSASLNTTTLANGKHSLTAIATDTSNNKITSTAVSITVNNGNNTPPTVSITSPASGATVSGTITVSANASDSVGVASVQFDVDGSNLGAADTSAPYSVSLNTTTLANGNHTLTAVATDKSSNKGTSAGVSINVNNAAANKPTVSVISPLAGTVVSGTITVSATASDSKGIASVQFQLDGSNLGVAGTSPPYSQSWNTTAAADGTHTLTAVATSSDSSQQPGTASVALTVNNSGSGPGLSSTPGWHIIPATSLAGGPENSNLCAPNNYNGYNFQFQAWCYAVYTDSNGAVADTTRNRMIIWGGGHNNYWGNDVFSLELNNIGTSKPVLIRLDNPADPNAIVGDTGTVETLAACSVSPGCTPTQQTPGSRHTYGGIDYLPASDRLVTFGGATTPRGYSSGDSWSLALGSVLASCAPNCDPQWTNLGATVTGQVGIVSSYDPNTGGVWIINQNNLWFFDPNTNTATIKGNDGMGYHSMGVVDPDDQYFITVGPQAANEGIRYVSIAAGSSYIMSQPPTTNCSAITLPSNNGFPAGQYPGLVWDPIGHRVVVYPNGGNVIWYLDPKTWTCSSETYGSVQGTDYPQNTDVSAGAQSGTFGHFQYFQALDIFTLCNDPVKDCWYLRPTR